MASTLDTQPQKCSICGNVICSSAQSEEHDPICFRCYGDELDWEAELYAYVGVPATQPN